MKSHDNPTDDCGSDPTLITAFERMRNNKHPLTHPKAPVPPPQKVGTDHVGPQKSPKNPRTSGPGRVGQEPKRESVIEHVKKPVFCSTPPLLRSHLFQGTGSMPQSRVVTSPVDVGAAGANAIGSTSPEQRSCGAADLLWALSCRQTDQKQAWNSTKE